MIIYILIISREPNVNGHLQVIRPWQTVRMNNPGTHILDSIDHVAIQVDDIGDAVTWYTKTFKCFVEYQDDTWAMLNFSNIKIALVVSSQHPPHIGIIRDDAGLFGKLKTHRDGSESCYISDPSKNILEVLKPL